MNPRVYISLIGLINIPEIASQIIKSKFLKPMYNPSLIFFIVLFSLLCLSLIYYLCNVKLVRNFMIVPNILLSDLQMLIIEINIKL